jgi:hypothetical protein
MVVGLAVPRYMLLVCLGSLYAHIRIFQEEQGTTGPNLIGRCSSNELVTEMRLVLRGILVLDPDTVNTTQHTSRRTSILGCKPEYPRVSRRCRTNP